jgi:F-type H+-transporting ATPase subunit b
VRRIPWLVLSCLIVGAPAAAESGEASVAESLVYPAINLALLLAVLIWFSRKPIQSFFADRRGQIQADLDTAAQLRADAEARCADLQRRLLNLDAEIENIRSLAQERAESERVRILTDAQAAAERIRSDAKAAVDQELRRARAKLREEASDLAIELAAKRLREQITDSDRDRLLDEFIEKIERDGDGAAGRNA